jgi:hypothetical protein
MPRNGEMAPLCRVAVQGLSPNSKKHVLSDEPSSPSFNRLTWHNNGTTVPVQVGLLKDRTKDTNHPINPALLLNLTRRHTLLRLVHHLKITRNKIQLTIMTLINPETIRCLKSRRDSTTRSSSCSLFFRYDAAICHRCLQNLVLTLYALVSGICWSLWICSVLVG